MSDEKQPINDLEGAFTSERIQKWIIRDISEDAQKDLTQWAKGKFLVAAIILGLILGGSYFEYRKKVISGLSGMVKKEVEKQITIELKAKSDEIEELQARLTAQYVNSIQRYKTEMDVQLNDFRNVTNEKNQELQNLLEQTQKSAEKEFKIFMAFLGLKKNILLKNKTINLSQLVENLNTKTPLSTAKQALTENTELGKTHLFATLAALVEENEIPVDVEQFIRRKGGFQQIKIVTDKSDKTLALVVTNITDVVVAFGVQIKTEEDLDQLFGQEFALVDGPFGGKVHNGFYSRVNNLWQELESTIENFNENRQKSLWFTGHGLGGALATLAVARLRSNDQPVDGLYTFGQPRVGDSTFARNFNLDFKDNTFRYVNDNDIVTLLPPRALTFRHVGTLKYFTETGNLVDDIGYWNRFLDRVSGRVSKAAEKMLIINHSMMTYLNLVKKAFHIEHEK